MPNTLAFRPLVPVVTVVTFTHWFYAFSIPSPIILGCRRLNLRNLGLVGIPVKRLIMTGERFRSF